MAQVEFTERWLRNLKPDASGKQLTDCDPARVSAVRFAISRAPDTILTLGGHRKRSVTRGRRANPVITRRPRTTR